MNHSEDSVREEIIGRALSARTLQQIEAATLELNAWVEAHPDDIGIRWAFEQMALVESAIREIASTSDVAALTARAS